MTDPASRITGVSRHALRRAQQRLGHQPTKEEWFGFILAITERDPSVRRTARMIRMNPDGTEQWEVTHRGQPLLLVWSPAAGEVVTVPPADLPDARPPKHARLARIRAARQDRPE
ncbi:hypothetical protein [Falsiroseomonas tokyonensis]|uniref:Uncharacterized protein n=1 Tax=Falsiroseomonas tokyonensis TaxID=430521 RepID=A0ABV7BYZ9_9PROT|nr:hypothetical protein [Falsiroseomonas tokyonensis]MBU8540215.1 hypothetical protein [Falsiroseomonas tokyonensis]